ncbi:hypothetical protein ACLK1T_01760 [Escherichia coli]
MRLPQLRWLAARRVWCIARPVRRCTGRRFWRWWYKAGKMDPRRLRGKEILLAACCSSMKQRDGCSFDRHAV